MKVAAVVVTHNRKEHLLVCLEALAGQTAPVERVFIVDNASSDGTYAALVERGFLAKPDYRIIRSEENTGGAGGFRIGLSAALETDAEWLWVMDDDVAPQADCLAKLIDFSDQSECIHPNKVLVDGSFFYWEQYLDILTGTKTVLRNTSFENGKSVMFTNVACFEGALISRRIVNTVGLPDANYFISEDDTLFGVKASVHTNVAYVSSAVVRKLIATGGFPAPWKVYYIIRNKFFLYRDACDYLGVSPNRIHKLVFLLMRVNETFLFLRLGRKYWRHALRGFVHGVGYMTRTMKRG